MTAIGCGTARSDYGRQVPHDQEEMKRTASQLKEIVANMNALIAERATLVGMSAPRIDGHF